MALDELKLQLHLFIKSVNDENVLISLLNTAEGKQTAQYINEEKESSGEDYEEYYHL